MSFILDLTSYKCKRCGKDCIPKDSLRDIWDVYKKAGLCPDCYDEIAFFEVMPKIHKSLNPNDP